MLTLDDVHSVLGRAVGLEGVVAFLGREVWRGVVGIRPTVRQPWITAATRPVVTLIRQCHAPSPGVARRPPVRRRLLAVQILINERASPRRQQARRGRRGHMTQRDVTTERAGRDLTIAV